MTPGITITRILRDILRIPVPNTVKQLGPIERISLATTDAVIGNNMKINRFLVSLVGENILSTGMEDTPAANVTKSY